MESNAVFILNEYRARQAKDRREYAKAIHHSQAAAEAAAQIGDDRGFCRMTFSTAELQLELGRVDDCITTCQELLASKAITEYLDYESRTRVLMTHALHDKGEIKGALAAAREVRDLPLEELSSESRLFAQQVLVAALAEDGDTEGAWSEALDLAAKLAIEVSPRTTGMGYWTVGNAAFMSARLDEGLKYHRLAAVALTKHNDVNTWALFNKASAHMRLATGLIEEGTRECVERAEVACEVAGVTEMDRIEIVITRAWWELESGNAAAAEKILRSVAEQASAAYPVLQGRLLLLLARCLHSLGHVTEALDSARESQEIFTRLGAAVWLSECRAVIDTIDSTVS